MTAADNNLQEERHTEAINEIIGNPPSHISRWGISAVAILLAMLLIISYQVQYAEVISAEIKINSTISAKPVVSKTEGRIVKLFVRENAIVQTGQVLGYLESMAVHERVIELSGELQHIQEMIRHNAWDKLLHYHPPLYTGLGEMQAPYQAFISQISKMRSYLDNGLINKRIHLLEDEISRLSTLRKNLQSQQEINIRDYDLSKEEFDAQEYLFREKVLSRMDHNHNQSKLLNKQLPLNDTRNAILSNEITAAQKKQEILSLRQETVEGKNSFVQSLISLSNDVDNWKRQFLLVAPISGKIIFSRLWQENENVSNGEVLFHISPDSMGYFGEMYVSQDNFGKVEQGQTVLLSLASYPSAEYGKLKGKINFISSIPDKDSKYLVTVMLDRDLISDNKIKLNFRNDLVARAEIITRKKRLISKLMYTINRMLDTPVNK